MSLDDKKYKIDNPQNAALKSKVNAELHKKLKPFGAFGFLEDCIIQLALHQNTEKPSITNPAALIFSADHRLSKHLNLDANETANYILSLLNGSAPVHTFNKHSGFKIKTVDIGIDYAFESNFSYWLNHGNRLINARIAEGAEDITTYPALTTSQMQEAFDIGYKLVNRERHFDCNFLSLAGWGSGSIVSNLAVSSALLDAPVETLLSTKNTFYGISAERLIALAKKSVNTHPKTHDVFTIISLFGSYELAALSGALVAAAHFRITVMIDNLTALVALLGMHKIAPEIKHYCILADSGYSKLHKLIAQKLELKSILNLHLNQAPIISSTMALPNIKNVCEVLKQTKED